MEFQKEVMNDIFVALVDSLHYDGRIPLRPPPILPSDMEKSDSIIKAHNSKRDLLVKEYHRKLDSIRRDSSKLKIAIYDTINDDRQRYLLNKLNFQNNKEHEWDTLAEQTDYRIDLSNFEENEHFRFRYGSELPKDINQWYDLEVYQLVGFSTIVFNKSKTRGVLSSWTSCGKLCGSGFLVFLKKANDKWIIERVKLTEVS